eukprot:COSAG03_NODE_24117_length_274_cov_1.600000_1_plen_53_part_10
MVVSVVVHRVASTFTTSPLCTWQPSKLHPPCLLLNSSFVVPWPRHCLAFATLL